MKKIPLRTCIGCMKKRPKYELVRLVLSENGVLKLDPTGKVSGRGSYLCCVSSKIGKRVKKELFIKESCMNYAIQRKAFTKAYPGEVNLGSIEELPVKKDE